MEKILIDSNIVVVSRGFNVPLFSQLWLKNKGIFSEEEIQNGQSLIMPMVVQIDTDKCNLLVQAERIQMQIKSIPDREHVIEKMRKIITLLPECPYTGVGFNFSWNVTPLNKTIATVTKENFLPKAKSNPWRKEFGQDENAKIGAFYSKPFRNSIMSLDIRPKNFNVASDEGKATKEGIAFTFNFHHELKKENSIEQMKQYLDSWFIIYNESKKIVDLIN